MMKERLRWGDPMAHLVNHETPLMDLGADEKMKVWIFIPQSIPKHNWLTRGLEATPSPYGIKPGRHYWDGVDCRHEKDRFKKTRE
ncbi:hypothetical protein HID58_066432 [Brassica napus]|uniref:Uncharacterized protein n=2 Tax=Brassica napus TaxID=3708 RepID=A0ABQ7ZG43_BRANA|nr:hypothetical protein HID58_066432 [Brassica napus]